MKYNKSATLRFAFMQSLPVLFGYLFLGAAFGIMLFKAGYNWMWAALISLLVYAGSGQFLLVSLISSGAGLATTALMTLFINTATCSTACLILKSSRPAAGAILL